MPHVKYWLDILWLWLTSFDVSAVSTIILGLTLIVIIGYTSATCRLWKEARFQSELAINPLIVVRYDEVKDSFFVKNLGKGIAIDIVVTPFTIYARDMKIVWKLEFNRINLLEPESEKFLTYKAFENDKELQGGAKLVYYHITPNKYKKQDLPLTIFCQNILGHKYYTHITTGKSGVRIIKIGRTKLLKRIISGLKTFTQHRYIKMKVYFYRRFKYKLK